MDTAIIAILVGYEALAFSLAKFRWGPPLITRILKARGKAIRWGFTGVVGLTLLDHLSLINIPVL